MFSIKKLSTRHYAGYEVIKDEDEKVIDEGETLQCCHCGSHFRFRPGSGTVRGWCYRHQSVTCGSKQCDICKNKFGIP